MRVARPLLVVLFALALAPGSAWAGFDRGVGASAYFGPLTAEPERRAA